MSARCPFLREQDKSQLLPKIQIHWIFGIIILKSTHIQFRTRLKRDLIKLKQIRRDWLNIFPPRLETKTRPRLSSFSFLAFPNTNIKKTNYFAGNSCNGSNHQIQLTYRMNQKHPLNAFNTSHNPPSKDSSGHNILVYWLNAILGKTSKHKKHAPTDTKGL